MRKCTQGPAGQAKSTQLGGASSSETRRSSAMDPTHVAVASKESRNLNVLLSCFSSLWPGAITDP